MRGLELGLGAGQTVVGLAWLVLLWSDRGREPAKRQIPHARLLYALLGVWSLVTGPLWIVRGLSG
jgi:hypothetical protein